MVIPKFDSIAIAFAPLLFALLFALLLFDLTLVFGGAGGSPLVPLRPPAIAIAAAFAILNIN